MIGLFDSGIGGLTVVKALMQSAPQADFVYLGDTARTPYGNKSPEIVKQYALEDAGYVISKGAKLVIVACNTASALALDELKAKYPDVPFIGVAEPAAQEAVQKSKKSVGVIGTRATINSGIYDELIHSLNPKLKVSQKACPLFVPLVEEGLVTDQITKIVIRRYLTGLRQKNVDSLILGCTHYPFLKNLIQRFMGKKVAVIDSANAVIAKAMREYPLAFKDASTGNQVISFTDTSAHLDEIASKWLGKKVKAVKADLPSVISRKVGATRNLMQEELSRT